MDDDDFDPFGPVALQAPQPIPTPPRVDPYIERSSPQPSPVAPLFQVGQGTKKRGLGIVTFKPRSTTKVFSCSISNDLSLLRDETNDKYEGVLHFIDAIERELTGESDEDHSLDQMMGRVSIGRGSGGRGGRNAIDQDLVFEKDPLAGVKMDHGNVWL